MDEKICPRCGIPVVEKANFCVRCGASLTDASSVDSSEEQVPMTPPQYAPSQTNFSARPVSPYGAVPPQPPTPPVYVPQPPVENVPTASCIPPQAGASVPPLGGFPPPYVGASGVPQPVQPPYAPYNGGGVLRFCRHCGRPLQPGTAMCLQCGMVVGGGNAFCPQCGQAVMAGATMCMRCYTPLVFPNQKSKIVAGLLGIFLGFLGIHNFYLGHIGRGLTQLLVTVLLSWLILPPIGMFVWGLVEAIQILAGNVVVDAKGIPLKE